MRGRVHFHAHVGEFRLYEVGDRRTGDMVGG